MQSRVKDQLRSWLRRRSVGKVLLRRIPESIGGGRAWVTPEAALRYWLGIDPRSFEHVVKSLRRAVPPGGRVWDIGANLGLVSIAMSRHLGANGYVLAIEPDAFMMSLLRRSVHSQDASTARVETLLAAVSDSRGLTHLIVSSGGRAANRIDGVDASVVTGSERFRDPTLTITLDWAAENFPLPDAVKIDVEGAEELVLKGGSQLLKQHRPVVLFECQRECTQTLGELFRTNEYVLYDANRWGDGISEPIESPVFDSVAVPSERVANY